MVNNRKSRAIKTILSLFLGTLGIIIALGALTFDLFTGDITASRPGNVQFIAVTIGLAIILLSHWITPHRPLRNAVLSIKAPSFLIFNLSFLLILLNVMGLFIPLRNPAVYDGIPYASKVRVPKYTVAEFRRRMNRNATIDEQYPQYVQRLTQLVYESTVHFWPEADTSDAFNLRVPLYENFLLSLMNKIQHKLGPYEFCRAERAVERAASVCSQSSRILANLLLRNRIRAQIIALDGHVIVQARVNREADEWWLLDADYGVVIQQNLQEVESNPEIIINAYQQQGYPDQVVNELASIYGPEGNQVIDEKLACEREEHLYLLKWLLPIVGMLPFLSYLPVWYFQEKKQNRF